MSKAKELIESLSVFEESEEVVEKSNEYEVVKSSEHNVHHVKHNGNIIGSIQKLRPGEGHKVMFKEGKHWRLDSKHASDHDKAVNMIKKHHKGQAQI